MRNVHFTTHILTQKSNTYLEFPIIFSEGEDMKRFSDRDNQSRFFQDLPLERFLWVLFLIDTTTWRFPHSRLVIIMVAPLENEYSSVLVNDPLRCQMKLHIFFNT